MYKYINDFKARVDNVILFQKQSNLLKEMFSTIVKDKKKSATLLLLTKIKE